MESSIPGQGPRRSQPGPHTSSAATPKRALSGADSPPIMSGYTYQPGHPTTAAPTAEDSVPLVPNQSQPDSIANYQPSKRTGWLIGAVVLVTVIIATVVVLNYLPSPEQQQPSPDSSAPATSAPPARQGGILFANEDVTGYWKITRTTWESTSVNLTIEITVDSGILYFDFYAYDNGGDLYEPIRMTPTDLEPGFLAAGETVIGTLSFQADRQPLSLIMVTVDGMQLSALQVEG